jgi:hypothetical protein
MLHRESDPVEIVFLFFRKRGSAVVVKSQRVQRRKADSSGEKARNEGGES